MAAEDDMHIEVVDSRESALLLHVDSTGATRMSTTLSADLVSSLLRQLADLYEADHG